MFPLKGADLTALGATPGPKLGEILKNLEEEWIESGFALDRGALLERAAQALKAELRSGRVADLSRCASGSPRSSFRG